MRLCSIECCFAHPLATCASEENRRFRDDIIAWQPVAPLLYIWDYTPNFAHYQQPFPNFDALQPNVRFFVQHDVKGLFEQGNYSGGGYGEMGPLRAYVLGQTPLESRHRRAKAHRRILRRLLWQGRPEHPRLPGTAPRGRCATAKPTPTSTTTRRRAT